MEPDLIYEIRYQIHSLKNESVDALGNSQDFVDMRTIYTLHAPPVAHEKLEAKFAPRKVEILHYSRFRYLP